MPRSRMVPPPKLFLQIRVSSASEKLVLESKMHELNQSLKVKDDESTRRENRMRKKHKEELEQVEEGYNDQFDEM